MHYDGFVSSYVENFNSFCYQISQTSGIYIGRKTDDKLGSLDTIKSKFSSDSKGNFFLMTVISCRNLFDMDVFICKTLASAYNKA